MAVPQAPTTSPATPATPATPAATQESVPPPRETASPTGTPAGKGTLRRPGEAPRDVPLMSIQKDEVRVQVGPVTQGTGVADVLLGSLGIVAVAVIAALVLGALLGAVLVFVKHRLGWGGPERDAEDHISLTDR
ncbi:hypothetical protein TBR22_A28260 [Luteitalea sp. TBR-22]|uniref:hypothetical protein n=1 Tax=Luteitalea sp. TBR-22 TaxID=2802971 RepID=UPI001AF3E98F|nr:hypothetical protein [Luteitalea sp. TBR-22]BCS33599.1 hypothetical protein TBR22_A28260 [Luteitalea sp. TBR-22]